MCNKFREAFEDNAPRHRAVAVEAIGFDGNQRAFTQQLVIGSLPDPEKDRAILQVAVDCRYFQQSWMLSSFVSCAAGVFSMPASLTPAAVGG